MKPKLSLNILIMLVAIITITGCIYSSQYGIENRSANAQQPIVKPIGIKIVSPIANQSIPVGELNISGTSTDTATTDCNVYVDVNDFRPLQNTTAAGPGGQTDYSNWTFTYTKKYHLIAEGQNELTAKISCNGNSLINSTSNISSAKSKWYSINVTGMAVQTPAEKSRNENQIQSSNANQQQNVTVSVGYGPESRDLTTQPLPSKNTQEQKIADLNEKKLDALTQEDQNSQENIPVQIESSTQDKTNIPNSFNAPMDLGEETGSSSQQLMPSSDTITEDAITEDAITEDAITEDAITEDAITEDAITEDAITEDAITEDTLSYEEEPLIGGPTVPRQIQPPLQMIELPNEGETGTQVVEEEDFHDIELVDHDPNSQGYQLQAQLLPEPDQKTQMQPTPPMSDIGNQDYETVDERQVIKTEDDDEATGSAEEIFLTITGNSGQENDLHDFGEDVQEQDSEKVISDQIPLVLSYTTEIQDAIE
jgi:hypothetical protein